MPIEYSSFSILVQKRIFILSFDDALLINIFFAMHKLDISLLIFSSLVAATTKKYFSNSFSFNSNLLSIKVILFDLFNSIISFIFYI